MADQDYDVYKAAGVLIKERKLLMERSRGKDFFVAPGGKLDPGEDALSALIRELNEEYTITVDPSDCEFMQTFYANAAGKDNVRLRMDVFMVHAWQGEPVAAAEVEEIAWFTSKPPAGIRLGSIFEHDVIPLLVARGLID